MHVRRREGKEGGGGGREGGKEAGREGETGYRGGVGVLQRLNAERGSGPDDASPRLAHDSGSAETRRTRPLSESLSVPSMSPVLIPSRDETGKGERVTVKGVIEEEEEENIESQKMSVFRLFSNASFCLPSRSHSLHKLNRQRGKYKYKGINEG